MLEFIQGEYLKMISRTYDKLCDIGRLTQEIIASGKPVYPDTGARFYGVLCGYTGTGSGYETIVQLFDDATQTEIDAIDTLVANHVPIPLPPEPPAPLSEDGKPYVRAEVRPLDCTTYFTNAGDIVGTIGGGKALYWDFSNSDDVVIAPTGFKRKRMDVSFIDFVYLKSGVLTVTNVTPGSYLDYYLVAPAGSYILVGGNPYQLPVDMPVAHFVN
jgi:hypothetical protein